MATQKLFLPTPKACDAVGLKRFPGKYAASSPANDARKDSVDIGVQYKKFGDTNQAFALQNLETKSQFNPRDIKIEVLSNNPYTITTEKDKNGNTISVYKYGDKPESQYEIHISPYNSEQGFDLTINHEHEWGSGASIFDKILTGATELVGNVDDFITKSKNLAKGLQGKSNSEAYKATPNRRIDVAETYIKTTKQSITIPFVLFTPGGEQSFVDDVYLPIMTLTKISYPKRSTTVGQADKYLAEKMGIAQQPAPVGGTNSDGTPVQPGQTDTNTLDAINSINPGFRVFVSDPPSYVNVSHNGGLFKYNNCYISKFTYKYRMWVDGDGTSLKRALGTNQTITDAMIKNSHFAYPLIAECELEIKTTEPLFSDDFVALSAQYGKDRLSQ